VGDITSRTPLGLERALEENPQINILYLISDGGDVHAALSTARIVDRKELVTFIPKNEGCYSACAYIYFAGRLRQANGELGVHQTSSEEDSNYSSQVTVSEIIDELGNYNVPPEVYVKMFSTPPDAMYIFSEDELASLRLSKPPNLGRDLNLSEPENQRDNGGSYSIRDDLTGLWISSCKEVSQLIIEQYKRSRGGFYYSSKNIVSGTLRLDNGLVRTREGYDSIFINGENTTFEMSLKETTENSFAARIIIGGKSQNCKFSRQR
jgi:hypothetical protein